VSLLLPVAGVAAALYGVYRITEADSSGWYWVAAGTLLVLADMTVDWIWARPAVAKSDEPNLNRRGAELVGQVVMVVEPIELEGRGKVQRGRYRVGGRGHQGRGRQARARRRRQGNGADRGGDVRMLFRER
jgi:membrane protein implicated in regulation of membrane protease activity